MKIQHLKVVTPVSRLVQRQLLKANKNAPTILFVGGVVGIVGATVLACRATLKVEPVIEAAEKDIAGVNTLSQTMYTEKTRAKELTKIKIHTAGEIAKLYAPAVVVGTVSILCLTKSHNILMDRNAALMAAYSALDMGFREYRQRVVDELGEEKDLEFRHGAEERTLVQKTEKGSKTSQVTAFGNKDRSMYARIFDDKSKEWTRNPDYNFSFLTFQQRYWNNRLRAVGHVFLNEVYDNLGLERSMPGSVVGWFWDGDGDNYIDFGIFDDNEQAKAFVFGHEGSILLDFNVDGVIYDLLDK